MASINVCWIKWIRTKRPAKWRIFIKKTVDFVFWVQFYPAIHYCTIFPFFEPCLWTHVNFFRLFSKSVNHQSNEHLGRTYAREEQFYSTYTFSPPKSSVVCVCMYNFATPENSSKLRSRHLVFVSKRIIDLIFTLKPIWKH